MASMTLGTAALRRRWQAWWQGRQPVADTHQTTQRNVYIVPTWAGVAFCCTLGVLLLASINEQISLGYALTFALTGAGLASMHTTHGNLRGLQMDLKAPDGVHAGDDYTLELRLHNPGRARFGIAVSAQLDSGATEPAWVDVPALGHAVLQLRLPAARRGLHALPRLIITTRFPLGFFRAWSYWRPASQVWVYPQPEAAPPPSRLRPKPGRPMPRPPGRAPVAPTSPACAPTAGATRSSRSCGASRRWPWTRACRCGCARPRRRWPETCGWTGATPRAGMWKPG